MRNWFRRRTFRHTASSRQARGFRPAIEGLESRCLLAAPVIDAIPTQTVFAGKSLIVPVTATHADTGSHAPLSYSVSSSDTSAGGITAQVLTGTFLTFDITIPAASSTGTPQTGQLTFELFSRDSVQNVVQTISGLVKSGFYNNLTFHRIISGFVIQGGDPKGDGTGGPPNASATDAQIKAFQFNDQFDPDFLFTGTAQLAMAKSTDDTNGSQFFVTLGSPRNLDFNHTIFGQLVRGKDFLAALGNVPVGGATGDRPTNPPVINRATIVQDLNDTVLLLKAGAGKTTGSAMITVRAQDSNGDFNTVSFQVNAAVDPAANNTPPILGPIADLVTPVRTVATSPPLTFTLTGRDLEGDKLVFAAQEVIPTGGTSHATVSVSGNQVTVTPTVGFTGSIQLQVGVGDAGHAAFASTNGGDTQTITIAVGGNAITGQAPSTLINVLEGTAVTNAQVATFTTTDTAAQAADFTASISWGDGQVSTGTVAAGTAGTFVVTGTNTYQRSGRYLVRVTISHATLGNRAVVFSTATITDRPLTTTPLPPHEALLFNQANLTNGIVATFSDPDANTRASDYVATIDWGDGSAPTNGTVVATATSGRFNVTGTHKYGHGGTFNTNVTIMKENPADDAAFVSVPVSNGFSIRVIGPEPTNESFVAMLYNQLLGRTGDAMGMLRLSHLLNRGVLTHEEAANFIINSEEYRTKQVKDLYQEILGRAPDKSGQETSLEFLLEGGRVELLRQFLLQSDEFFQTQGNSTTTGFVNALYQHELGRSIDASGMDTFQKAAQAGATRAQLANVVITSEEFYRRRTGQLFQLALGHPLPSQSAADVYFTAFKAGVSDDQVTSLIASSDEFNINLVK